MSWRAFLIVSAVVGGFPPEASACSPIPMEPPLAGESNEAYRQRVEALEREREAMRPQREAEWLRDRQAEGLAQASVIFIARRTLPPQPRARGGRPIPPPVFDPYSYSQFYRPVAWLRGPRTSTRFRVHIGTNSCGGVSSIGDISLGEPGEGFVFFARGGRLSEDTLIDAIAVGRITDPALIAFVAQFRRH
jgi:hypothetical protein